MTTSGSDSSRFDSERPEAPGRTEAVAWRRLPGVALLTILGAVFANSFLYLVAWGLHLIPHDLVVMTPYGPGPVSLAAVVTGSAVGALGGSLVFALVGRLSRRPIRHFRIIATLALLPTFRTPLTIPDAPLSMILSLEVMHIVAYAVTVLTLTTLARRNTETERRRAAG